jgi:hypothetical protein
MDGICFGPEHNARAAAVAAARDAQVIERDVRTGQPVLVDLRTRARSSSLQFTAAHGAMLNARRAENKSIGTSRRRVEHGLMPRAPLPELESIDHIAE